MKRAILAMGFLALALPADAETPREQVHPRGYRPRHASELRLGTYNLYIGSRNPSQTAQVIRKMAADVVVLQEVAPENAAALGRMFSRDYPYRYFESGLGIISRFPLRKPRFERSRRGINGFLFAEIEHPRGRLQIANLHLDPLRIWTLPEKLTLPLQFRRQGNIQRDELAQACAQLRGDIPTILLGDFNRGSDAAIHQLRELGYVDSFGAVTPRPDRTPTLHFSLLGFRSGRRIDFIFHDPAFKTIGSEVIPGRPSDHDAVVSRLRWKAAR
jgi:endonuclease/exonuclease/phosphatase family metal-dependent hydrolase